MTVELSNQFISLNQLNMGEDAVEGMFEDYVSALLILHDMMLPLYDSGEHPRFSRNEAEIYLAEDIEAFTSQPILVSNIREHVAHTNAIIELHRHDPVSGGVAAEQFALAILHFYRDLGLKTQANNR